MLRSFRHTYLPADAIRFTVHMPKDRLCGVIIGISSFWLVTTASAPELVQVIPRLQSELRKPSSRGLQAPAQVIVTSVLCRLAFQGLFALCHQLWKSWPRALAASMHRQQLDSTCRCVHFAVLRRRSHELLQAAEQRRAAHQARMLHERRRQRSLQPSQRGQHPAEAVSVPVGRPALLISPGSAGTQLVASALLRA